MMLVGTSTAPAAAFSAARAEADFELAKDLAVFHIGNPITTAMRTTSTSNAATVLKVCVVFEIEMSSLADGDVRRIVCMK